MLLSFLPAFAYWYLESSYPLHIALMGGLGLAVLEITFEKIYFKKIHKISLFNFYLIMILGLLSLIGDEGIWFKLQPCFTGVGFGVVILVLRKRGTSLWADLMKEMSTGKKQPPMWLILRVELHLAYFLMIYGLWMGGVAIWMSTDAWIFFKTLGFYICFAVFLVIEIISMRRLVRQSNATND